MNVETIRPHLHIDAAVKIVLSRRIKIVSDVQRDKAEEVKRQRAGAGENATGVHRDHETGAAHFESEHKDIQVGDCDLEHHISRDAKMRGAGGIDLQVESSAHRDNAGNQIDRR